MRRGWVRSFAGSFWIRSTVVLALGAAAIAGVVGSVASTAWAVPIACVSGGGPLVTPCLIGSNLVLNSADLVFSSFGSGHGLTVTFLPDGITLDTTVPLSGPGSAVGTYSISTLSGLATIEDVSASLSFPVLFDTATFTTPGGNLALDSLTPSGEKIFAPVSSLSESITISLGVGETLEGFTIRFSQVPEPSALLLLGSGLLMLGGTAAWRKRNRK